MGCLAVSAIGEANPYEFTSAIEDTSVYESSGDASHIVATGPLTFRDYRHAIRIGAARWVIIVLSIVSLPLGYLAIHATGQDLIEIGVRGTLFVLFVAFSIPLARRRDRRLFAKMQPVQRWLITDIGFHQEQCNGESVFIPYSSVLRTTYSQRVIVIIPNTGYQFIVPRAGFTEDGEWQRFIRNLQRAGNKTSVETKATAELTSVDDSADTTGVVVTGPMNDAEAVALLRAMPHQRGFLKLYACLLPLAFLVALLGTAMSLFAGQEITTALVAFLPLAVCLALSVVGVVIIRKALRQAVMGFSRWVLTSDGIEISRAGVTMRSKWDSVKSKRIIREGILLFGEEPHIVYLVPRSGFNNERDWQEACGLVGNISEAA